ncbi:ankyrin repeat and protein kinase domain-containing protein 1-like [Dysidea avara]|uniref:ankyrin repeat and protein kinase domain-containing protein 1-like n=1 Tax=Dysidea avara TaxID=196820 RepID=UPI003325734B
MAGVAKTKGRKPTKEECDRLKEATINGDVDSIKGILSNGVDVNAAVDSKNWTTLHYAALHDQPDVIRVLHEYGVDINCQDVDNQTPLRYAASGNHPDVIRVLHEYGADVNCQDKDNWTPLHYAASANCLDAIRILHEYGADVNCQEKNGDTPLYFAAFNDHVDAVKILHKYGGNMYCKNKEHKTPLHDAVDKKRIGTVKCIVEELKMNISKFDEDYKKKIKEMLGGSSPDNQTGSPDTQGAVDCAIDCAKTAQKLKDIYDKLTKLPINSMLPQLFSKKAITEEQKRKIKAEKEETDGMQYFLDKVLIFSLELDVTEIYCSFVEILENSDDLIQHAMAKKIGPSS